MRPLLASVLLLAALASTAFGAGPTFPPFSIRDSETRVLPPSANGRRYQLSVALPGSYASQPGRRYPVLYVTDAYWDFPTVQTSYANLAYDRAVPEFIIVGIGYAGENLDYNRLRQWELPPVTVDKPLGESGHAAEFLRAIETEIIPFVDRTYRTDPSHRVMAGSSLGGLFTLYAMYTKPDLFQGYIAVSPAVAEHKEWLLGYEEDFARSGKAINARLFVSGAENEWPWFLAGTKHYAARLAGRHYPGFQYEYRLIDGMRHAGTKAEGYVRGMQFVFLPMAPETGPMQDHPY